MNFKMKPNPLLPENRMARDASRSILGALLLSVTQQLLTVTISSEVNVLVLGLMLVLFVVGAPEGILGLYRRARTRIGGKSQP